MSIFSTVMAQLATLKVSALGQRNTNVVGLLQKQEQVRVNQIADYRAWYNGHHFPTEREDGALPYANHSYAQVEKSVIWLTGKSPKITFRADIHTLMDELIQEVVDNSGGQKIYYEALQIRKKALGDLHPLYAETLSDIGLLYLENKQNEPASAFLLKANKVKLEYLRKTNSTLSEEEKITRMNEQSAWFSHLPSLLYNNIGRQAEIAKEVYSNELPIKGMILEDPQTIIRSVKQAGVKPLYE